MHILIAPNAFKNSLDASAAARAIGRGLLRADPSLTITHAPIGDGGDGTGRLLTEALNGRFVQHTVQDPLGRNITTEYGMLSDGTAVIEMAAASGIRLLGAEERDPLHAHTFGTGELLLHALGNAAKKIWLCVGGSATVDGGCGILKALGVRFLDHRNSEIHNFPEGLLQLAALDLSGIDPRLQHCECMILCDVTNPLLGEKGAAGIFGPQKGASPEQVIKLEQCLQQLQRVILHTTGKDVSEWPHGGAAGGVVASLCALTQAKAVNGIEHFLDAISFNEALNQADLVITGEGSIDLQTLDGKAPFGVALRAKQRNIPVIALSGKEPDENHEALLTYFHRIIPINEKGVSLAEALASTEIRLEKTGHWIGEQGFGS